MTKSQLRAAIRADAHRENYDDATLDRFIREGESVLLARLEAYSLTVTLTDADRPDTDSAVYTLPQRLTSIRHVFRASDGVPLNPVSETGVALYAASTLVTMYCKRPQHVVFAGLPSADAEFTLAYWGVPDALDGDDDTNTLIADYPGLYKNLAMSSVYERMKAYDQAELMLRKSNGLIDELNRKAKKALGGRSAGNAYNTAFRSSY